MALSWDSAELEKVLVGCVAPQYPPCKSPACIPSSTRLAAAGGQSRGCVQWGQPCGRRVPQVLGNMSFRFLPTVALTPNSRQTTLPVTPWRKQGTKEWHALNFPPSPVLHTPQSTFLLPRKPKDILLLPTPQPHQDTIAVP